MSNSSFAQQRCRLYQLQLMTLYWNDIVTALSPTRYSMYFYVSYKLRLLIHFVAHSGKLFKNEKTVSKLANKKTFACDRKCEEAWMRAIEQMKTASGTVNKKKKSRTRTKRQSVNQTDDQVCK